MTWLEHAAAYAAMNWPLAAAHSRRRRAVVRGNSRRGPSESRDGRIWHRARSIAATPGGARLRPYDLRHAALSLWLASGALPADVAARAGHSVRVLLAVYAHCIPGATRSPASTSREPSTPATGPPLAHKNRRRPGKPVRHASVPQLDPAGHS
jgi:hypothetical protein